ncbi:MAG: outer membrane lipoprotein carrier protein LolA [Gracilimonas sp.]|uniref:LolA family protein n=2 Tax=Balneolaceae TaxID=1813606 RepID=UPI001B0EFD04|nr:outer membrane lipoprotein carrier protein LolA [Gracilimonas sp.]MBO6585064.1 outer membrane lipoprotein carrier protein LolA [Gracilimonas sp.]MBO6615665.1 outer membrane lipoprotein carrier protein LolA [Gracilimonas sp.]
MSMIRKSFQLTGFSSQLTGRLVLVPNLWFGTPVRTSGSKKLLRVLSGLFFFSLIFSLTAVAQTPNFDQLKEKFDEGLVFRAMFNQTFTDSYTGEVTRSEGQIWLDKVRYKLEADGQVVVVDGETSKVYDPSRNRVIIDLYNADEDDFAPSRMLSGIDTTYTVSEGKMGDQTIITLISNDDFAVFVEVEIIIDEQFRPTKITAWDISDNEIVTTFSDGAFLKPETGLFQLDYPDDAEVVDMRY